MVLKPVKRDICGISDHRLRKRLYISICLKFLAEVKFSLNPLFHSHHITDKLLLLSHGCLVVSIYSSLGLVVTQGDATTTKGPFSSFPYSF